MIRLTDDSSRKYNPKMKNVRSTQTFELVWIGVFFMLLLVLAFFQIFPPILFWHCFFVGLSNFFAKFLQFPTCGLKVIFSSWAKNSSRNTWYQKPYLCTLQNILIAKLQMADGTTRITIWLFFVPLPAKITSNCFRIWYQ